VSGYPEQQPRPRNGLLRRLGAALVALIGLIAKVGSLAKFATSPGLLGRLLQTAKSSGTGELFSYLFFAPEFFDALIAAGRDDAHAWLGVRHDFGDDEWQKGPLN